ncbi:acyl CoA--acetate/3-ketoacid CoA transferase subunit alpha [Acidiferrimicrobium sp. IK]|uniref:CoA transferase subunit A n=1 Tax=Acidiferrimicrobium sp. IK TaxID=2871700 RepID=UPI0021CB8B84|nr:CoA-transferase [Acidiferrimicrobium sp. IK]MCU4184210.1 acyl CoA--acetate/3-ketoacid CoA transferase subunit alpha [Acidiferrimicrobium sp. IK]
MRSKIIDEEAVVAQLEDGMCIGIGGWGSRRKPMSMVAAIARSSLRDLTVVSFAGPDLGLLCAAGKVARAVYPFASLDSIPLEPHFRQARQDGAILDEPWDEGMFVLALQAAAWRVPFLPTRVGLGSDLVRLNPRLALVRSPFADHSELVAVPALTLDAAICHLNRADSRGNASFLGPDLYFDDLLLRAAPARRFVSVERIVATPDLLAEAGTELRLRIGRMMVDGVIERPGGAWFTSCTPDYERDEQLQKTYAASAADRGAWEVFRKEWIDVSSEEFAAKVAR